MWPMFKKELRENRAYAAAAFVLVLLVLDYIACSQYAWSFLGLSSALLGKQRLLNPYQIWAALPTLAGEWNALCIILAIVLALRQVYTERIRRTWPLLAQMPVRRETVVYAKLLAGVTLLAAILVPAGLLIVVRLSTPGVWPGPVYLLGFLPLLWHFLAAVALYQAIFLTALTTLRWWGTRWLIPFTAVPAMALASMLSDRFGMYGYYNILYPSQSTEIWIVLGITLLVAVASLWAIRAGARTREY